MGHSKMTNSPTFPIDFINNAQIVDDKDVFVTIKATNNEKKQCLVEIKDNIGVCKTVTAETNALDYSYRLTDLSRNQDGSYEFNLTQMYSARVYLSVKYPLQLYIDSSNPGAIAIIDPDGFKTRDANYYTVYDKFEFTYNNGGMWMNPTAVDFFSIPLQISMPTSTSAFQQAGLSDSRSEILNKVKGIFDEVGAREEWNKLFLKFGEDDAVLRVMSPGKAMIDTGPGSNPVFAPNYLSSDKFGLNYIEYVWDYYSPEKGNKIKIDYSELAGDRDFQPKLSNEYIFEGHTEGDKFIFSNQGNEKSIEIVKPHSISFFAGAQGSFSFPNHSIGAIIARELTSAFDAGLLPAEDDALLKKSYFESKKGEFYKANPNIKGDNSSPWYDVYSKAFHSFEGQPVYTFAYDDALGQDGTLRNPNKDAIGKVTVKIGDLSGLNIPNPYEDSLKYTVTVNLGKNGNEAYYNLVYNGQTIIPGPSTILRDVSSPLKVKFNSVDQEIYLKHHMVEPYNPITDGIVIIKNSQDSVTVNFPGPPANIRPEELSVQTGGEEVHDEL